MTVSAAKRQGSLETTKRLSGKPDRDSAGRPPKNQSYLRPRIPVFIFENARIWIQIYNLGIDTLVPYLVWVSQ